MKKERPYLLLLISITVLITVIGILSVNYLYHTSEERFLKSQLQSSEREAREIARLLEQQLAGGLSQENVIQNLQKSIENTDTQSEFICMYNTEGVELCHPDPAKVGNVISADNSVIKNAGIPDLNMKQLLYSGKPGKGVRSYTNSSKTELIYIQPVTNTNWMVAAHANIATIKTDLDQLYIEYVLIYIMAGILIITGSLITIHFFYKRYESRMESEKKQLHDDVLQLTIFNEQLQAGKKELEKTLTQKTDAPASEKNRILVYKKDELISLPVTDVAYVYTANNLTHIVTFNQGTFYTNQSLDDFLKPLSENLFFRVNRQFIVNIQAIKSIIRYGKNQLKLVTEPVTQDIILISKNKVSEFKEWLDR